MGERVGSACRVAGPARRLGAGYIETGFHFAKLGFNPAARRCQFSRSRTGDALEQGVGIAHHRFDIADQFVLVCLQRSMIDRERQPQAGLTIVRPSG